MEKVSILNKFSVFVVVRVSDYFLNMPRLLTAKCISLMKQSNLLLIAKGSVFRMDSILS